MHCNAQQQDSQGSQSLQADTWVHAHAYYPVDINPASKLGKTAGRACWRALPVLCPEGQQKHLKL